MAGKKMTGRKAKPAQQQQQKKQEKVVKEVEVAQPQDELEQTFEEADSADDDDANANANDDDDDDDDSAPEDDEAQGSGSDGDDGEAESDADTDNEPMGEEDDDEVDAEGAVGFGDAMSKILGQNVSEDAQPILAKRTTARMREIQNEKREAKTARLSATERRMREQKDMVIPDHTTVVQDRKLRMIATKGVVALFNAIEKHQHASGKKDEQEDKKVKEMSKENFLGLLKASQKTGSATEVPATKASFLKDDYMMGAKPKDWDAAPTAPKTKDQKKKNAPVVDEDGEAVEDAAWKQVANFDDDDEGEMDDEGFDSDDAGKPAAKQPTQQRQQKRAQSSKGASGGTKKKLKSKHRA
ncbi:TPA: hypothetical protein N0F65_007822 [Lagenidium giganteum]|uniref:RRP15-like protein n=1 Tax=Lagenidium giganteum TaxID=4803 RepID=A0AAV2Z364_9STRA|nr:TPA: hypothetical protein N0F65_007822 [Lagenidium giganteum]